MIKITPMIDSHAHLFLCQSPVEDIIRNAKQAGVRAIIHVAIDIKSALQARQLTDRYPALYPTAGVHPSDVSGFDLAELEALVRRYSFQAIGETGLDYFRSTIEKNVQIEAFEAQLDLARRVSLPVVIHNRHADEDMIAVTRRFPDVRKVFHCFASDMAFADAVMSGNSYFSFTGMITYAKKGKVIQSLRHIPMDRIMIETDCPYLTPEAKKGEENQPAFVGYVADKIAEVKGLTREEVVHRTYENTIRFFELDPAVTL